VTVSEFCKDVYYWENETDEAIVWWREYDDTLSRRDTMPECDKQTDGRIESLYKHRASADAR